MKLIIAIVSAEDQNRVSKHLTQHGYSATKLSTTGGFLSAGNTTFLIGCEEDKVDYALDIIKRHSQTRKRLVPSANIPPHAGAYISAPMEVVGGGATVFLVDVEKFEKM